jgi:hypothetical protein
MANEPSKPQIKYCNVSYEMKGVDKHWVRQVNHSSIQKADISASYIDVTGPGPGQRSYVLLPNLIFSNDLMLDRSKTNALSISRGVGIAYQRIGAMSDGNELTSFHNRLESGVKAIQVRIRIGYRRSNAKKVCDKTGNRTWFSSLTVFQSPSS